MKRFVPRVGVIMGSSSDRGALEATARRLEAFGIPYEMRVLSAHRSPKRLAEYASAARGRGLRVMIAGAGAAAHLAGAVAAHTNLPVIGVPLNATALNGVDAFLSTVQMPAGVPVATVAIGEAGAENAAILAAQILALGDPALARKLNRFRKSLDRKVERRDRELQEKISGVGVESE